MEVGYKTQTDFKQAIAGVYALQQQLYRSNASWFYGIITRADETKLSSTLVHGIDQATDNANKAWSRSQWPIFWKIIGRSNLILDYSFSCFSEKS